MRKHFLILMLLALLPLAGWAANGDITTNPAAATGLKYTGLGQDLVTPGEVEGDGWFIYYAVVADGTAAPAWGEAYSTAVPQKTNAGAYDVYYVTWKTGEADPTTATAPHVDVAIAKADMVPANITQVPVGKTSLVYSGQAQDLITAGTVDAKYGQFYYSVDGGAYNTTLPKGNDADDYVVTWKVNGSDNYNDYVPTGAAATINVTIAKKNLKVKPVAITTYFGSAASKSDAAVAIDYDGFVEGEDENDLTTEPTASFDAGLTTTTLSTGDYFNAGTYNEGLVMNEDGADDNYNFIYLSNKLKITPAKVKVDLKAGQADATYGTATSKKNEWEITWEDGDNDKEAKLNVYVQNGGTEAEPTYSDTPLSAEADFIAYLKNRTTGSGATFHRYFNSTVKMYRSNTSEEVGQYLLSLSGIEATNNSDIVEQTNKTNIKFNIIKAVLTIKASNKWKTYGTEDPTEADGSWAYTVKQGAATYTGLNDSQTAAIKAALTRAEGETAGDYKISFAESVKTDDLFKDNYTITWTDGWLTIEKAELTIVAKPQTLYVGNKIDKLVQTEYTVTGLVPENTTVNGVTINDAAEVSLAFGTTTTATETEVPVSTVAGHEGELTGAGSPYIYGIKIILTNEAALAANYNITKTNGELTVIDTNDGIVLNFAIDNTEALAAADTKTIEVTMGNKTMVKDNWHTMVLPFATTPLELSKLLNQYVVINRLSDNSTASHVAFELELNEIPAGEAFLIKSGADIVWDAKKFSVATTGSKKLISKNISAESKGGNKIVGVYATTSIQSTDAQMVSWLGNTSQKKADGVTPRENKWYEPYSAPKDIAPFEAYLMYAPNVAARPMITVQDADGTVTAISEVKAGQFQEIKTDGWYTINGVKLEGAPTEKGIYINNGKKIVVK